MRTTWIAAIALALITASGCGFSPTQARVRIIEHQKAMNGDYFQMLYIVLEPKDIEGRYGIAATRRNDLIESVDGAEFDIGLNFTMVPCLSKTRPLGYSCTPPQGKDDDFLEMAKRKP
ncbi:MAG: hypothetical protein WCR06_04780 [bacterium]